MSDYEYDENLPYVVPYGVGEIARFSERTVAVRFSHEYTSHSVIDTTPEPRIPADAKFVTWGESDTRWYAERRDGVWILDDGEEVDEVDEVVGMNRFPGVTDETVFTVLDERKSDD